MNKRRLPQDARSVPQVVTASRDRRLLISEPWPTSLNKQELAGLLGQPENEVRSPGSETWEGIW